MYNPVNPYSVNEHRELPVIVYLFRRFIPIYIREKARQIIRGEGFYYKSGMDSKEVIFIHIPKAAGTSISKALFGERTGHNTALAYKAANAKKYNQYFKFSVVRNPWARLLSSYNYLKSSPHEEDREWARDNIDKYEGFEEFVIKWVTPENIMRWKHFIPQSYFLCDETGKVIVDAWYKLEYLNESKIEIEKVTDTEIEHLNRSATVDYRKCYTDEMINVVAEVYRADVDLFGYSYGDL